MVEIGGQGHPPPITPQQSTVLSLGAWASRGRCLTRTGELRGGWENQMAGLGDLGQGAGPVPFSLGTCSYPNLPLGGADDLQSLMAPIHVAGAKAAM